MVVLDTSVIAKWFLDEEGSEEALKYRQSFLEGKDDLIIPDLALYELSNVLKYKGFEKDDITLAIKTLFDLNIRIIVPTLKIISVAIEKAFEYDISLYDAQYVALADELGFLLITADKNLHEATKATGFVRSLT